MITKKILKLESILQKHKRVLIAFSGGVDSTFLAKIAVNTLHENAVAAIAVSPSLPEDEKLAAIRHAENMGIKLLLVETNELELENYRSNPEDRCYHCKKELMTSLMKLARNNDCDVVMDGFNTDDIGDYRPGLAAANEIGILHPLFEAGFSKLDIRNCSKELGLSTWNKPAMACLASRIPYGTEITNDRLKRIEMVEKGLKSLGFTQVRARFHEPVLRIEVAENEIDKMLSSNIRQKVVKLGEAQGFKFTSLDLAGYQTGNLNRVLDSESGIK